MPNEEQKPEVLKARIREKYNAIADELDDPFDEADEYPEDARYETLTGRIGDTDSARGRGRPTEHAQLQIGETVLDLGSGLGLDAFVAGRQVGASGRVIGVDMSPAMVRRARQAAEKMGFDNVDFRIGELEELPVTTDSIDVAVSNCVLNLVPDKQQALREIRRVLRPGGRLALADVVSERTLPEAVREAAEDYAGCITGALTKDDYLALVQEVGFADVQVVEQRPLELPDDVLCPHLSDEDLASFRSSGAALLSVTVLGRKPEA